MNSKDNKLCPKTQLQYNLKHEGATSFLGVALEGARIIVIYSDSMNSEDLRG